MKIIDFRSLSAQLWLIFTLSLVLPALLIGGLAFDYEVELTKAERIKAVGRVSDMRREELVMVFRRASARAERFLNYLGQRCGNPALDRDCLLHNLNSYLSSEHALGAVIGASGQAGLVAGDSAVAPEAIPTFKTRQLAWFVKNPGRLSRDYVIVVDDPARKLRLAVTYPVAGIQPIFVSHPDLGNSGETFLADDQGFFITGARYPSTQGHSHPISATPMRRCLTPEDGETLDLDYRDVPVIHGFRFIPEVGGGCIMAHTDQAEAFAPLKILRLKALAALLVMPVLAVFFAQFLARRILRPIDRLIDVTKRIANGEHTLRAQPAGYDEVAELATAVNAMTTQLVETNASLEKRVQERTESLRLMSNVFEGSGEGICISDRDNNIVAINRAFTELTGYRIDELRGKNPRLLASGSTPHDTYVEMWQAVIGKGYWQGEVWDRHKAGHIFPIWLAISVIRDAQGQIVNYFASFNDISQRKAVEQALQESEERWHFAIDGAGDGVWDWNLDSGRIVFSKRYLEMLGYGEEVEWNCIDDWKSHVDPEDMGQAMTALEAYLDGHSPDYRAEYRMRGADGAWKHILARGKVVSRTEDGRPLRLIGTHTDISERKQREIQLKKFEAIVDSTDDAIISKTLGGIIQSWNKGAEHIFGYTAAEAVGQSMKMLIPQDRLAEEAEILARIAQGGRIEHFETIRQRKDGRLIHISATISPILSSRGEVVGASKIARDISKNKILEEQVRKLAFYDALTNLPNRRLLNDRLAHSLAASKRDGLYGALMFLDLDNFKPLNDAHGHDAGDLLLIEVANRLRACVRETDTVARFGGDEFVVILGDLDADRANSVAQATAVAEKIRATLSAPYQLHIGGNGHPATLIAHRSSVSIGIALFLGNADPQDEVMRRADTAMYRSKAAGRDQIRFFTPEP